MRNRTLLVALIFLAAASARAEWTFVSVDRKGAAKAGVAHYLAVAEERGTGERATIHFAVFSSRSATFRVIDQPSEPRRDLAEVMGSGAFLAGVNGGYFDPEDAPVGLLVADGQTIAPLRHAKLLSGILSVGSDGVRLLRLAEFGAKTKRTAALQCGPFLVDHARPVAGLNDTRAARRTFVVTGGTDRVAIGVCSDVTLAGLARLLSTPGLMPEAKVDRALNLDGGSSSAFWFRDDGGDFSIVGWKTVRNFVGVVAK